MLPRFTKHSFTFALPNFEKWVEICPKALGSSEPVHLLHPLELRDAQHLTFLTVSSDRSLRFAGSLVQLDFSCYSICGKK